MNEKYPKPITHYFYISDTFSGYFVAVFYWFSIGSETCLVKIGSGGKVHLTGYLSVDKQVYRVL
jgi:hypothetical protein